MRDKKFQKKKDRAKEVRKKVLRRRERIRAERKAEEAKERELEAQYEATKPMPLCNDPEKRVAQIKERLEKNMAILEALEKEYLEETNRKGNLNKELEEEGAITLAEKLDALGKKHTMQLAGTAPVRMIPRESDLLDRAEAELERIEEKSEPALNPIESSAD